MKPFYFPENNWQLCYTSAPLSSEGPHVLTVNVTTKGTTFWFDYLEFAPPPNKLYGNGTNVLSVPNTDPAIVHDASWVLDDGGICTTKQGAQVTFNFTGVHPYILAHVVLTD